MRRRYIVTLPVEIDVDDDTPARSTEYRMLNRRILHMMLNADPYETSDRPVGMKWQLDPEDPGEWEEPER